ncbi:MAG: DUF2066 domain-containing protein [Proteobacteria bacterium]|nr:DUF2066 domain-containing protein [Pseudomonadota bacterium]
MKFLYVLPLLFTLPTFATEIDIYSAATIVEEQNPSDWNSVKAALEAVISKQTGISLEDVNKNQIVNRQMQSFILRYYFEQAPVTDGKVNYWHYVHVDGELLNQYIKEQGLPIWPKQRKEVFVWVVEENEAGELSYSSQSSLFQYWLLKWLENKGIAVKTFSSTDNDILVFDPDAVKFLKPELAEYTREHYELSDVLMVFGRNFGNGYAYRMGLSRLGQPVDIKHSKFISLPDAMEDLTSYVQNSLVQNQQINASEMSTHTVSMIVNNLTDFDQMSSLLSYFEDHSLIKTFQVVEFANHFVRLQLKITVLPTTFVKFVGSEGFLEYQPVELGSSLLFTLAQ